MCSPDIRLESYISELFRQWAVDHPHPYKSPLTNSQPSHLLKCSSCQREPQEGSRSGCPHHATKTADWWNGGGDSFTHGGNPPSSDHGRTACALCTPPVGQRRVQGDERKHLPVMAMLPKPEEVIALAQLPATPSTPPGQPWGICPWQQHT